MVLLGRVLLAIALLGTVGSTLRAYPHQLAYFNELAGGPYEGWRHLLGSSLDWGQGWLAAAAACRRLGDGVEIVCESPNVSPRLLLACGVLLTGASTADAQIVSAEEAVGLRQVAYRNLLWRDRTLSVYQFRRMSN